MSMHAVPIQNNPLPKNITNEKEQIAPLFGLSINL